MCLTAFYLNPNPSPNEFRFVIAFNRDEFYVRPSKTAEFWASNPDVISSVDMTPGKEGGTWLGMSKRGRVAFVLNIFNPLGIKDDAKGRGALVSNFLTGEQRGEEYLTEIAQEGEEYNWFNLFTVDIQKGETVYYSNRSPNPPQTLQPGVYGVSNSTMDKPWPKANHVKGSLEELLQSSAGQTSEGLSERLHQVLQKTELLNGEQFEYDPQMPVDTMRKVLPQMIHVKSAVYGTRTSTVIVVDSQGEVLYSERSIDEPVDAANPHWSSKEYRFNLTCSL